MSVQQAIDHYQGLLAEKHLESTQECLRELEEKHQMIKVDRQYCSALQPYIFDASTYRQSLESVNLITRGLVTAVNRLITDEKLRRQIGFPAYLDRMLEIDGDQGEFFVLGRFDGYLYDGELGIFEFNTSVGTLTLSHELTTAFDRTPIADEFGKRFPYQTTPFYSLGFDAVYEDHLDRGGKGPPSIGTVRFSPEVFPQSSVAAWMRWYYHLASQGCALISAHEEDFRFQDGRLFAGDTVVDILAFSTPEELYGTLEMVPVLEKAVRAGGARVLDGLSRSILGNHKCTFEVLSNPRFDDLFEREVVAALRRHIPWTRTLQDCTTQYGVKNVDLLSFVEDNRDRLVIKPSGLFGGEGVTLGWSVDDDTWRRRIREGVDRLDVVQERVKGEQQSFPVVDGDGFRVSEHYYDFDTYVWNARRAEGCLVRICEREVTNISSGASSIPVWILED